MEYQFKGSIIRRSAVQYAVLDVFSFHNGIFRRCSRQSYRGNPNDGSSDIQHRRQPARRRFSRSAGTTPRHAAWRLAANGHVCAVRAVAFALDRLCRIYRHRIRGSHLQASQFGDGSGFGSRSRTTAGIRNVYDGKQLRGRAWSGTWSHFFFSIVKSSCGHVQSYCWSISSRFTSLFGKPYRLQRAFRSELIRSFRYLRRSGRDMASFFGIKCFWYTYWQGYLPL